MIAAPLIDGILCIALGEYISVLTVTAVEGVIASTAIEDIITVIAVECVVSGFTVQ